MANMKIKSSRQIDGKEVSADRFIIRLFTFEGAKTFGEINLHLKENGIQYSKKGLHLRLNRLLEERKIIKTKHSKSPYPVYDITQFHPEATMGEMLRYCMEDVILEDVLPMLKQEQSFKLMTTLVGVYSMYVDILSWKLISPDDSMKEMFEKRSLFLRNALPLVSLWSKTEYEGDFGRFLTPPEKYTKTEFRESIIEFEKTLRKAFPGQMKICDKAMKQKSDMMSAMNRNIPRF